MALNPLKRKRETEVFSPVKRLMTAPDSRFSPPFLTAPLQTTKPETWNGKPTAFNFDKENDWMVPLKKEPLTPSSSVKREPLTPTANRVKRTTVKKGPTGGVHDKENSSRQLNQPAQTPKKTPAAKSEFLTPQKQTPSKIMDEGRLILDANDSFYPLYLGSSMVAQNNAWLQLNTVVGILNATSEIKNFYPNTFAYKRIPADDSADFPLAEHFSDAHEFIHEQRRRVHCQMGQSRSVTIIQSYLIRHENMSLLDVCQLFEEKNILIKLNQGFQQQLMKFEKDITGKSTKDFFSLGTRSRRSPSFYSPPSQKTTPRGTPRSMPRSSSSKLESAGTKTSGNDTPYKAAPPRTPKVMTTGTDHVHQRTPLARIDSNVSRAQNLILPLGAKNAEKMAESKEKKERLQKLSETLLQIVKKKEQDESGLIPKTPKKEPKTPIKKDARDVSGDAGSNFESLSDEISFDEDLDANFGYNPVERDIMY